MQAFSTAYFLWVVGKAHEFDVSLALFVCAHEEFQEAGNILCGFLNLVSPWIMFHFFSGVWCWIRDWNNTVLLSIILKES